MKTKTKSAPAQPFLLVDSEVVRKIRQHARSSNATEICGILIGHDRDNRIEVTASIEGENADQAGAHVTFTQDTWEHIYAVKDKKFPNDRIVGWYHSHPGFGIFLSEHDTFIHKNFFSSPGQVAWVFDPHSDEEGCFGWVNGRIERLTRIAIFDRHGGEAAENHDEPEPTLVRMKVDDTPLKEKSDPDNFPIRVERLEAEDAGDTRSLPLEELVAKVFFSLALLVLGFALCWFVFPRLEPVLIDPRNGNLVDFRTGEVVGQLKSSSSGGASQADPAKPVQPSASDAGGKKGDDAKPK